MKEVEIKFIEPEDLPEKDSPKKDSLKKDSPKKDLPEKKKKRSLESKCNELIEKLESEKSPVKRTMYTIKLKMLIAKFEKEINIAKIKEDHQMDKAEIEEDIREDEKQLRRDISDLIKKIGDTKEHLRWYKEYDYDLEDFSFLRSDVEKNGGIDKYAEVLRESGAEDAADKIELALELKKEIEEKKKELEDKQEKLSNIGKEGKKRLKSANKEEKSLINKEKGNIFQKIATFFGGLTEGMKSVIQESINKRNAKRNEKQNLNQINKDEATSNYEATQEYEEAVRQAKLEYEKNLAELKEQYAEAMKRISEYNQAKREEAKEAGKQSIEYGVESVRQEQVRNFREELRNLAKESDDDGYLGEGEEAAAKKDMGRTRGKTTKIEWIDLDEP